MDDASLQWADFSHTVFTNGTAAGAAFDFAYMEGATLSGTHLDGASFTGAIPLMPANSYVEASSESGADVSYTATSIGPVPGAHLGSCSPGPGFFPVGSNPVTCAVVDDYGNSGSGQFSAVVGIPTDLVAQPAIVSTAGNVLTMSARLTDAITGVPVAGASILFWISPQRPQGLCWALTDSNGVATCSLANQSSIGQVVNEGGYEASYYGWEDPGVKYVPSDASAGLAG